MGRIQLIICLSFCLSVFFVAGLGVGDDSDGIAV